MVFKKCCITNCFSTSLRQEDVGVTYHKFPKDCLLRNKWAEATNTNNTDILLTTFVCSRHFRKLDFQLNKDSKYFLKPDAVPSIFPWTLGTIPSKMSESDKDTSINNTQQIVNLSNSSRESENENLDAIKKYIEEQEKEIIELKNSIETTQKNVAEISESTNVNNDSEVNPDKVSKLDKVTQKIDTEASQEKHVATKTDDVSKNKNDDSLKELVAKTDATDNIIVDKAKEIDANDPSKNDKGKEIKLSVSVANNVKKKPLSKLNMSPGPKGGNGVALSIGSKVEAKDFAEYWHAAKIVEVDYDEMEVLVHYEDGTKSRHDEWISVSSPRLRPQNSSPAVVPSKPPDAPVPVVKEEPIVYAVKEEVRVEEKPKLMFSVGERCLARWRDNRRFMATVQTQFSNGSYEIMFDDGVKWKCGISRLSKLKDLNVDIFAQSLATSTPSPNYTPGLNNPVDPNQSPNIPLTPAFHTHLFDPTRDYLGSKRERREMKRKLNIKEIFNIGQKKVKKEPKDISENAKKQAPKKKVKSKPVIEVKKEIPDAVASIIGTVDKSQPAGKIKTETEIKTEIKEEVPDYIDQDTIKTEDRKCEKAEPVEEELILEKFEKQDNAKHEEVIDKIKEVINKLEDGLEMIEAERTYSPKLEIPKLETIKQDAEEKPLTISESIDLDLRLAEEVINDIESKERSQPLTEIKIETVKLEPQSMNQIIKEEPVPKIIVKIKKSKKMRLFQERKVKKQVEKVKSELEAMRKQVEEMKQQMMMKEATTTPAEMPESFLLPGEWCCKWVNGQPVGSVSEIEDDVRIDANNKPGLPRRSVQVEDKRLPPGWTKHMVRRSLGHSAGKWDVVLVSPENRRFHTKHEMRVYLEKNPSEDLKLHEHALFDFGVHLKLSRRMGWVKFTQDGDSSDVVRLPASLLGHTSPLIKRKPLSLKRPAKPKSVGITNTNSNVTKKPKKKVKKIPTRVQPPPAPAPEPAKPTSAATTGDQLQETLNETVINLPVLEDGYVYVGSLKVQVIENLLRCPAEGCFKNFRNNTLIQMHIKHYHTDLIPMLGAAPKVVDMVYARRPELIETEQKPKPKILKQKPHAKPESKETKQPKLELTKVEIPQELSTIPPDTPETEIPIPNLSDSPKLRQALANQKPVKRPKVLLPVRRPDLEQNDLESDDSTNDFEHEFATESQDENIEALDFETAISTHTVTKPADYKKGKKKKTFALFPNRATSEDEEWYGMNSDMDTSSIPRSGSPDSKSMDNRLDMLPASSESNEEQKDPNSYIYNENGERIKIVHMKREEIINCHCGFREEDGLMVQCELCLCWQHALCHNIQKESEVPEKYTCSICLNPRRGRRSQRFLHDQDRLYEGLLPGAKPCEALRRSHELSGNLLRIEDALHALRVKYYVATKKDHPKLYLWAKDWENGEINMLQDKLNSDYSDLSVMLSGVGKENLPVRHNDVHDLPLDIRTPPSEDTDADRYSQRENVGSHSLLSGLLSSPSCASLDLPISTSELEKLAKSVQDQDPRSFGLAPQPEAAIENSACRARLLRHIQRCQALIDTRLHSVEAQVAELESQDPSFEDDETADYFPRTKQTIQMLLRDLDTMEELGVIT